MQKSTLINIELKQLSKIILYGSLGIGIVLTVLLFFIDLTLITHVRLRSLLMLAATLYLVVAVIVHKKHSLRLANWMIIFLYGTVSGITLVYWGLNMPAGIFTTSFVVILSSVLLGSRVIFPTLLCIILFLITVQVTHHLGVMTPNPQAIPHSPLLDVINYSAVFAGFSLVTWLFGRQIERSLVKVASAEAAMRVQKESLAIELEKESRKLRQAQMKEVQQLYKFAMLGQNSAATLHELSNHLTTLNMDISDLKQHHQNSQAIASAEESIAQINATLRQVKHRLHTFNNDQTFHAFTVIQHAVKDLEERYQHKNTRLDFSSSESSPAIVVGDPLALMQAITILLTNALDACSTLPHTAVSITAKSSARRLVIRVSDNGIGIANEVQRHLFSPMHSTKPSGMGVGLYIAKHLIETQLKGTIRLESSSQVIPHGTCFAIIIGLHPK